MTELTKENKLIESIDDMCNAFKESQEEVGRLERENAQLKAQLTWIPIADRLPSDTLKEQVFVKYKDLSVGFMDAQSVKLYRHTSTHWLPIPPVPEPKYRPFANAEEFAPYREKWLRTKNFGELWRVYSYNNKGIITPSLNFVDYKKMFGTYDFEDGSPCGKEDV